MNALKRQARLAACVIVLATFVLSLTPANPMPSGGIHDKWGHLLAYAGMAFTCHTGWTNRRAYLVVGLIALGAGIEVVQGLVGRNPELADIGANALGVLLGVGMADLAATLWRSLIAYSQR